LAVVIGADKKIARFTVTAQRATADAKASIVATSVASPVTTLTTARSMRRYRITFKSKLGLAQFVTRAANTAEAARIFRSVKGSNAVVLGIRPFVLR